MAPVGSSTLRIQNSAQKGIAGRGVLLDWGAWMDSKNTSYDAFTAVAIPTTDLAAVAKWQSLDPESFAQPGDFLVAVLPYRADTDAQWLAVEASDATPRWLWANKLSLVGSDNPMFESVPFNGTIGGVPRALYQLFIGGWGQSIEPQCRGWYCEPAERYDDFMRMYVQLLQ
ncbi:hypothetical protein C8R44DRAFT_868869 [Mycena epipterygia]|nr:hypothetical protein C8R44DRAFT_868869 [Mycena epipterygia]